jgi:hypothetical protein
MKFMKTMTAALFFVSLMKVVVIICTLKRCRIMEPNSVNNDASIVHRFNYSDFEQILHGVFKKRERHRPESVGRSKKPLFREGEEIRLYRR